MLIKDVLNKIWEKISEEYNKSYNEALKQTDDELFEKVKERLKTGENFVLNSRELNITRILTAGCPHKYQNGKFSGCSMCDYMSFHADMLAVVSVLKDRNPQLYAQAMRFSFDNARGKSPKPAIIELVTGHDCLNPEEITNEAFEELFNKESLFSRKAYKTVFETRISSITYERLMRWKEKLGKKVTVEVGIEVWNEWVRNHWIHKSISNDQIVEAVDIIHKADCEISANILIGIPGFTEDECIRLFKESYFKLYELGTDYILCSPLSRKEKTLQGYIYSNLRDNEKLENIGIANGELTGMPSVFTVMDAIFFVIEEKPEVLTSMTLSPVNFPIYFDNLNRIYQEDKAMQECIDLIKSALTKFSVDKDFKAFADVRQIIINTDNYKAYKEFKDKQNASGKPYQVLSVLGEEITKSMWPLEWKEKMENFKNELELLK